MLSSASAVKNAGAVAVIAMIVATIMMMMVMTMTTVPKIAAKVIAAAIGKRPAVKTGAMTIATIMAA